VLLVFSKLLGKYYTNNNCTYKVAVIAMDVIYAYLPTAIFSRETGIRDFACTTAQVQKVFAAGLVCVRVVLAE